jgi:hypothetical protein
LPKFLIDTPSLTGHNGLYPRHSIIHMRSPTVKFWLSIYIYLSCILPFHMELLTFASAWWMQKFTPSILFPSDCTTMQHVGYHNTSHPGAQLCRCNFFTVFNLNPPDYNFFIAFNWILHDWINFFIAHFNFFSYALKWELKGNYEHILQMHNYLLSIEPEHQSPFRNVFLTSVFWEQRYILEPLNYDILHQYAREAATTFILSDTKHLESF